MLTRLYRHLLRLYPARFREEFAAPLERQFADEYADARGPFERLWLCLRTLADLAATIPAEVARELRQDASYALRVYRRRSLVTLLALVALALAIGATTGVFSVVNALLLRSLPFRQPERLFLSEHHNLLHSFTPAGFADMLRDARYLSDAAEVRPATMNLTSAHAGARVEIAETSAGFFHVLGAQPALGRAFSYDEDLPGHDQVAVIGYGLWQQLFGGDPRALGSTLRLNGVPFTIVGIAPAGFDYPAKTTIWTPTVFDMRLIPITIKMALGDLVGRLAPGASLAQASQRYQAEFLRGYPRAAGNAPPRKFRSLRDQLAGPLRQASLVLLGAVLLVLLIACANVAQLLLSRFSERRPEFSIRAALGASRARLVQQLLTESALLTLVAALMGLGVAQWAARLAALTEPAQLSTQRYTIFDWRVLTFTVAVAIATGLLFGAVPAALVSRLQFRAAGATTTAGLQRLRSALMAAQAALTVVLIAGSLIMGRTFLSLAGADLGIHSTGAIALNVSLFGTTEEGETHSPNYFQAALDRLRAVPGVRSAAAVEFVPLDQNTYWRENVALDSGHDVDAIPVAASPGYFDTIGTALVEGRDFTPADRNGAELVAIVNEQFVRELGAGPVIGRQVTPEREKPLTIVGVVRNLRFSPSAPLRPQFYTPIAQSNLSEATLVARVAGDPTSYVALCRDAVRQVDPEVPVYNAATFEQRLRQILAKPRFYTTAVLFFGALALLLAILSVYGVTSHAVAQRTHELGVRIAVGATPTGVRGLLLRQSLWPIVLGTALGVAASGSIGSLLRHLIDGAQPAGVGTCAAAALLLTATAIAAVWRATGRIARLDPISALRSE